MSGTQSLGEVRGVYSNKKIETCPQWQTHWHYFFRQDKNIVSGVYPNKIDGADNITSETSTHLRFEDGTGGLFEETKL